MKAWLAFGLAVIGGLLVVGAFGLAVIQSPIFVISTILASAFALSLGWAITDLALNGLPWRRK